MGNDRLRRITAWAGGFGSPGPWAAKSAVAGDYASDEDLAAFMAEPAMMLPAART